MGRKRSERNERRAQERAARRLARDRERLAALSPGASAERPIQVDSPAVIEIRALAQRCPRCDGTYILDDHQSAAAGMRVVTITCRVCHASRQLWFRLGSILPS